MLRVGGGIEDAEHKNAKSIDGGRSLVRLMDGRYLRAFMCTSEQQGVVINKKTWHRCWDNPCWAPLIGHQGWGCAWGRIPVHSILQQYKNENLSIYMYLYA